MKTAVAFGTFDGLHIGHQKVLQKTLDYKSVAVTFRFPPKLNSGENLLMTPEDKEESLKKFGIKEIKTFDFSKVKDLTAEEFLNMIRNEYSPSLFSCGFNFRFGKGALGDIDFLKKYCQKNGIALCVNEPVCYEGETVSSTRIRNYIENGEIINANKLLYEDFSFCEKIIHGDKRGRTLGFPTINQAFPEILTKPRFGVYETQVLIGNNRYKAITNIGIRPTYRTENIMAESFILNFSGDIYGEETRVILKRFIRDEKRFAKKEELISQIKKDIAEVEL